MWLSDGYQDNYQSLRDGDQDEDEDGRYTHSGTSYNYSYIEACNIIAW